MYPPFPPGFQLGPLSIRWYGIIMVTAIFVGAWVASRYVARRGQDGNTIWNLLLWVVIPAIIGARLYYVFIQSPRGPGGLDNYLAHPWLILAIWQGGIHIYGGLIGGSIALLVYLRVNKLPFLMYLDAAALALPLSQAIGRLGNFMNQELYGPPTTLPWGLRIDPAYRIAPYNNLTLYPESVRFQPLFLYEMVWNLIGFALISTLSRRLEKWLRPGDILLLYLIWYPLGRFFLEFFRTDSWFFPGTPFNLVHALSALVIIASLILLLVRHRGRSGSDVKVALAADGTMPYLTTTEYISGGSSLTMIEEYTFLRGGQKESTKQQEGEEEDEEEFEDEIEEGEEDEENTGDFAVLDEDEPSEEANTDEADENPEEVGIEDSELEMEAHEEFAEGEEEEDAGDQAEYVEAEEYEGDSEGYEEKSEEEESEEGEKGNEEGSEDEGEEGVDEGTDSSTDDGCDDAGDASDE